ncbi:hypothetical protein [Enterobacter phage N5822]|nr:hypothetical protein [Enterobacter phage N5822]QPD96229.1 hypothetical protein [Enterobacter phage N5822]
MYLHVYGCFAYHPPQFSATCSNESNNKNPI